MKYKIFSDIHLWAPHSLSTPLEYSPDCVYLGDIHDLKNTTKHDIPFAQIAQMKHNNFCSEKNIVNVRGNHDIDNTRPVIIQRDNIIFTHGHYVCWEAKKILKWELAIPEGIGSLKKFYLQLKHEMPKGDWSPSSADWDRAFKLQEGASPLGVKPPSILVMGHTHTKNVVKYTKFK